jgi:hypothetical protein
VLLSCVVGGLTLGAASPGVFDRCPSVAALLPLSAFAVVLDVMHRYY